MSADRTDGGPAFPVQRLGSDGLPECEAHVGLSLRDWFAGMALVGMGRAIPSGYLDDADDARVRAEEAYRRADAMLKQREE